ncbi:putative transposase [Blattamonas nauphoetae]|uniref:Transposase n=1 Tax=Blattamonas nauphoetae TaxID=2049346 RepID=A0ABQ9X0A4_9EUKA|nr:putative transposase [Blattamonas nauphoetae]
MDVISSLAKSLLETVKTILTTQQDRSDTNEKIDRAQAESSADEDDKSNQNLETEPVPECLEDTPQRAFTFAQECGLLPRSTTCPECGKILSKTKKNRPNSESRVFSCANGHPKVRVSVSDQTILQKSKLPLRTILKIFRSFWKNDSISAMQADCGIAKEAATKWRRICRHVCCVALQKRETKIGGPGKTVEVDEAHMIRSKGRRGKGRTGYWMVGGCEVGNPSAYFVEMVAARDRATLEEVCNRRIKKGTEIVTDMWKGYGFADTKKKKHKTVNHSRNEWVGPDGATTNHIEARWKHVRASLPKNGVPRWFHEGYIQAEQLRKMPWTFQDFLRECGSVTKDQLDLMMSFEDAEKQATIKLLSVDNDRRKKNAELIQKSDKVIRSHHNRKLKVIQKQQSLASIQLDIVNAKLAKKATPKVVHEVQPQLDEEWGPDSPRFRPPIQKTKRTHSTNRDPDFYYPSISKKERRKTGLVQSLLQQLQKKWPQFKVENVVGDGNCGFYAVQKSLTPEELEAHPDLRGELAEWERTNPHFFEEFGDNFEEGSYQAHLDVIGIDGRWISELDLAGLSHVLLRPIQCHYLTSQSQTYGPDHPGATIHVGYINNNHFVAML